MTDREFLKNTICLSLTPSPKINILEWMSQNLRLPSDSAEPGLYNPQRAPYQAEILNAISPQSPTRKIILCFGTQMGKTTCMSGVMSYYIKQYPRPQAFAFSNDGELKSFVKTKFNPYLLANPEINARLGMGLKTTGNTLDEKLYPGGFLKFISANVEANMRSYSVEIMLGDEIDTYPLNVGGNGSPLIQLEKRTTSFSDTRKIVFSSTPRNEDSQILSLMAESTYNKYFLKCPTCSEMFTFEFANFEYSTNPSGKKVLDAWFSCPHCKAKIEESMKEKLLYPEHGAKWMATNPDAPVETQGFFLPSFYAPLGWISWKSIAQDYVNALNADKKEKLTRLIAFYNTTLCEQFKEFSEIPTPKDLYSKAVDSSYKRGHVPNWVNIITTGGDVQKDRLEVTIMGWGKRLQSIVIDHVIINLRPGEQIDDVDASIWEEYEQRILNGVWARDDGFCIKSLANALDRSFATSTVDAVFLRFEKYNFYPVRGVSKKTALSLIPSKREKHNRRLEYSNVFYDVPTDQTKDYVYKMLLINSKDDSYGKCFFPADLPTEYFEQLVSERKEINTKTNEIHWVKIRDRNEALDCMVCNFAMAFLLNINGLSDDDWEDIAESQREQARINQKQHKADVAEIRRRPGRRVLSEGIF